MRRTLAFAFLPCALLCVLACAVRPAHAASPSVSYSTWIVSGDTVMLRFVLPAVEADRLTGSAIPVLTVGKLGQYILEHTAVSAAGHDCPAIDQGYDLGRVDPVRAGAGLYGFEILFRCDEPMRPLLLENHALFNRMPAHVNFARVQVGKRFTDQLFTADRQYVRLADPAAAPNAGLGGYVGLGFLHVLHDAARLSFLIAALLAVWRPRESLPIFGGLAAGYALALAAVASGLIVPARPLVEAFIGFLVTLCAVAALAPHLAGRRFALVAWPLLLLVLAIIAAGLRAPRPALLLAGAAGLSAGFLAVIRLGVPHAIMALPAAIFGFLDGFALSSLVGPLELAASSQVRMSIGYDLGALLAAAGVLALCMGALALAGRVAQAADRPILQGSVVQVLAAAVFAGLGTFWLVSRLHA